MRKTPARKRAAPRKAAAKQGARKPGAPKKRAARRPRIDRSTLEGHLRGRLDPMSDAVLAFPLFLTYQIGLLLNGGGGSGVDFITRGLALISQRDLGTYLLLLSAMFGGYAGLLYWLRLRGGFDPRRFTPMLIEASVYAVVMGSLIVFVLQRFVELFPGLSAGAAPSGALEIVVVSAGAGFHEELLFRLIGLGGLAWLLRLWTGPRVAFALALVVSSLLFALAHHVGPGGEAMSGVAFAYRSLAGVYFGVIYALRGFAVAAWTHALYDLYVLSFSP